MHMQFDASMVESHFNHVFVVVRAAPKHADDGDDDEQQQQQRFVVQSVQFKNCDSEFVGFNRRVVSIPDFENAFTELDQFGPLLPGFPYYFCKFSDTDVNR